VLGSKKDINLIVVVAIDFKLYKNFKLEHSKIIKYINCKIELLIDLYIIGITRLRIIIDNIYYKITKE
jgi:hypothetical protein